MIGRRRRRSGSTTIRFTMQGRRRVITIEGGTLAEVERERLRRLLRPLRLQRGTVTIRRDWAGRRRVGFSADVPEGAQQVIRNIVGNLTRLRPA